MTKIDQIAQAFAQGVKFAENLKLAMDAAKGKDDEDGHWVTVGEGEEARPVLIKGKKKAAKTESKKAESKKAESKKAERTESPAPKSRPRAQRSTSGEVQTVRELKDAYNVSADLIDEMTPKQADRPFLTRLDRIHKDAVALAESAPEITNSHELREMTRIMKNADKLVKALPRYYDRNYYGGWAQKIMGMVRGAEEAYTKLKERKTRGPNAAI